MHIFRLRTLSLVAAGAIALGLLVFLTRPAKPDEHAVFAPINQMFDGMSKRDGSEVVAAAIPGAMFVSMQYGTLAQETYVQLGKNLQAGTTHIDERIHDPLVRIDNDLAVVWAPFEFRIEGKLDHCGTDSFSLVHTNGKWLIASLSATLRKDCGTS
jgi:hypothetical protein